MIGPVPTRQDLVGARGLYTPAGRTCAECRVLHRHGFVAAHRFYCSDCYRMFLGIP